jgi:hypothetical protein
MAKAKPKRKQIEITKRALVQRINRRLAKQDYQEKIEACRSSRDRHNVGDFYRIDLNRNAVIGTHVDLDELGRELGVLKAWEAVKL